MRDADDVTAAFGRRLRAARVGRGWRQEDLAAAIGLTRSSVANIEAGRQEPPLSTLLRVAGALATTVAALVGEEPATALPTCRIVIGVAVVCEQCGPVGEHDTYRAAVAARREHIEREHLPARPVP